MIGAEPRDEDELERGVVLLDSIAALEATDAGAIVVAGSHGGLSAAAFVFGVPVRGVIFNDAGLGKDRAGVAGLDALDARGVPAAAVSHQSARIGDAADTLACGVISVVNGAAAGCGVRPGQSVREAVRHLAGAVTTV